MKLLTYILSLALQPLLLSQVQYPNSSFEIIYDANGDSLPFIIHAENGENYGFENVDIENPFMKGLQASTDSHTYKELEVQNGILTKHHTISETLVNAGAEILIKEDIFDHFSSLQSVDYSPFDDETTQYESGGLFNIEDFKMDGFEGEINFTGLDGISQLHSQESISANSNWIIGFEADGLMDLSESGLDQKIPAYMKLNMDLSYIGCKSIRTQWGDKTASLIGGKMDATITVGSFELDARDYTYVPSGQDPIMTFLGLSMTMEIDLNAYFLKDYGEYILNMSVDGSTPSEISFVYQGQTISQPLAQTSLAMHNQRVYTSRNYADSPRSFLETRDDLTAHPSMMQSWTWNGAFPWVYDNSSKSWFYYHSSSGGYFVYHANLKNWYKFDVSTGVWNPHSF